MATGAKSSRRPDQPEGRNGVPDVPLLAWRDRGAVPGDRGRGPSGRWSAARADLSRGRTDGGRDAHRRGLGLEGVRRSLRERGADAEHASRGRLQRATRRAGRRGQQPADRLRLRATARKPRSWRERDPLLGDLGEITVREIRPLERFLELLPAQAEQLDVADRAYGRRPSRVGQDPDLAEELPPPERCQLHRVTLRAPAADRDLTVRDDVEAVRGVALRDDDVTS